MRLDVGGPLNQLRQRTRLTRAGRLALALAVFTWVPFALLAALDHLTTGRIETIAGDLSVHARLLVALPLFVLAELLLDRRARTALERLVGEGYVRQPERARLAAILASAARLRDSRAVELVILFGSFVAGAAALAGWLEPGGLASGVEHLGAVTPERAWYSLVGLPAFGFLLVRALWRWAIWARVLGGLARLPLALVTAHPDRRGGIGFLKRPSLAFAAVFSLAASCVMCSAWATRMIGGAPLSGFQSVGLAMLVAGELVAFAPMVAFVPQLLVARRAGRRDYDELATDYVRRFQRRWFEQRERDELLGSPDFQSLADLGNTYRETVDKIVPLPFEVRDAIALAIIIFVPVIPLVLMAFPLAEVLTRLVKLLASGGR